MAESRSMATELGIHKDDLSISNQVFATELKESAHSCAVTDGQGPATLNLQGIGGRPAQSKSHSADAQDNHSADVHDTSATSLVHLLAWACYGAAEPNVPSSTLLCSKWWR